jgi:hypothetical protein
MEELTASLMSFKFSQLLYRMNCEFIQNFTGFLHPFLEVDAYTVERSIKIITLQDTSCRYEKLYSRVTKLFAGKLQIELERCLKICFKAVGIESENTADDSGGRYAERREIAARQMSGGDSLSSFIVWL